MMKRMMTVGPERFLYLEDPTGLGGEEPRTIWIRRATEHLLELLPEVETFAV